MSWRGIAPRRMGARPETLVAFRQDGRPDQGTRGAVRRAGRHDLDAKRKNRNAAAQWNAVRSAQRDRNVRTVPCTTRTVLGKMDSRAVPFKYPPGRADVPQFVLRRRADARRRGNLQLPAF